ncbi:MAG: F0F1 ATP synthase subunit A, partial [Gemmatimonadaceae bacterium]
MKFRSLCAMMVMVAAFVLAGSPVGVLAQDSVAAASPAVQAPHAEPVRPHTLGPADLIMPHIVDSKTIELPCFNKEWSCEWLLPSWPVHIGGTTIDLGPTKHVVFMLLAAILCFVTLAGAARAHRRATQERGYPKGFGTGVESAVLILRSVFRDVLGAHGDVYIPFVLTLFFFVLFMNLIGLVPYGSTPTGNLGVNATLAVCAFVATETAGMMALGPA